MILNIIIVLLSLTTFLLLNLIQYPLWFYKIPTVLKSSFTKIEYIVDIPVPYNKMYCKKTQNSHQLRVTCIYFKVL